MRGAVAGTWAALRDAAVQAGDWRNAFSALARYPYDLFDYAAEDAFLAGQTPLQETTV